MYISRLPSTQYDQLRYFLKLQVGNWFHEIPSWTCILCQQLPCVRVIIHTMEVWGWDFTEMHHRGRSQMCGRHMPSTTLSSGIFQREFSISNEWVPGGCCARLIQLLAVIHYVRTSLLQARTWQRFAVTLMDRLLHNGSINQTTALLYPTAIFTAWSHLYVCVADEKLYRNWRSSAISIS